MGAGEMAGTPPEHPETEDPSEPEAGRSGRRRKQSPIWTGLAPLIAFLAGPAIVTVLWALDVYVVCRDCYVSSYERLETLPPALGIGVVAGLVGSIITVVRLGGK